MCTLTFINQSYERGKNQGQVCGKSTVVWKSSGAKRGPTCMFVLRGRVFAAVQVRWK